MFSIYFQERERASNDFSGYLPLGGAENKGLFSTPSACHVPKFYEFLDSKPINMGSLFTGVSKIERTSRFQFQNEIHGSTKKSCMNVSYWGLYFCHPMAWVIKSPLYNSIRMCLENAQEISSQYELIWKVNQIFRDIHIGLTRSEYSHENSSPSMFFWGRVRYYTDLLPSRGFLAVYNDVWSRVSYQFFPPFKMNCYGFVWEVVCSTHIKAGEELKTKMQELSDEQGIPVSLDGTPCPFNLAEIFKQPNINYWMRIQKLEEIEAGDIMVYLPLNHDPSFPDDWKKPTGTHVMFVHAKGKKEGEGMQFSIIDSTRKAHSKEDSRFPKRSGIGNAPLTLIPKDEEKGIYVLQWGSNERQQVKEVVVGRIVGENTVTV